MSKAEKEKVVVDMDDEPLLEDLGLPDLLKEYRRLHLEEKNFETKAKTFTEKKKPFGDAIQEAIKSVKADVVQADIDGSRWQATLVKGDDDATKTDEDKLKENLMKLGKLDAALIAKIFKASQVPAVRKGYILVTVKDEEKACG